MKKSTLVFLLMCFLSPLIDAGTETYSGREMKQVAPPPCPEWYADREFNVGIWGTYVFTNTDYKPNLDIPDLLQSTTEGKTIADSFDRYIEADHAWGGGIDLKYFFCRYVGIGIEGWAVDARRAFDHVDGIAIVDLRFPENFFVSPPAKHEHESRAVGSVLATLTLRYPIPCTRFAPYVFAGGGGIFGGGEKTHLVIGERLFSPPEFAAFRVRTHQSNSEAELIGQFGGGVEVRITPHIGWINDFSWNVVDGPENNFGMVRSGLNFAF